MVVVVSIAQPPDHVFSPLVIFLSVYVGGWVCVCRKGRLINSIPLTVNSWESFPHEPNAKLWRCASKEEEEEEDVRPKLCAVSYGKPRNICTASGAQKRRCDDRIEFFRNFDGTSQFWVLWNPLLLTLASIPLCCWVFESTCFIGLYLPVVIHLRISLQPHQQQQKKNKNI